MEYPKINSLWKRHGWYFNENAKKDCPIGLQPFRQSFIEGDWACPEFGNIKRWSVEEKVDGTNIRILFKIVDGQRAIPSIMGRTSAAQIPTHLFSYLQTLATWETFDKAFDGVEHQNCEIWLFGEGYGPKIQSAGNLYSETPGFVLFDVKVGKWWLDRPSVKDIAKTLGIGFPSDFGVKTDEEIVEFVKSKPLSPFSLKEQVIEGVVCRSEPLMLFRDGSPIMWKLKCKEFK